MNETAKALLAYIEEIERQKEEDPAAYKESFKKLHQQALDTAIEHINTAEELLSDLQRNPDEYDNVEELKGQLEEAIAFYKDYYKTASAELPELPEEPQDDYISADITIGEVEELASAYLDGDEEAIKRLKELKDAYPLIIDIDEELNAIRARRAATKELIGVLSEGNEAQAEALLKTATLEELEKAGVKLGEIKRNLILQGNKKAIDGVILSLEVTELLKLWRIIADRNGTELGDNVQGYYLNKPQNTALSISRVANELIKIEDMSHTLEAGESVTIRVSPKNKDLVNVSAIMKYDDKNVSIIGRPIEEFDKTVHDGAAALYAAGNRAFTIYDLYRACNGFDIEKMDDETLKPYIESLEQSISRRLRIDATEQITKQYKGRIKKAVYENYFLPLKKIDIVFNNGSVLSGYAFLDAPPLYEYSSNIKQIAAAPIGLMRAGRRTTPETSIITNYLIKRIDGIKNEKNDLQNKIAYASIYEAAGIDESKLDKTQLMRKRKLIKERLNYFVQQGYITGFEEYKNGRAIAGVKIYFK